MMVNLDILRSAVRPGPTHCALPGLAMAAADEIEWLRARVSELEEQAGAVMRDAIRFALSRGALRPDTLRNFMADLGHAPEEFQETFRDGLDRGWWTLNDDMRCQLKQNTD